MPKLSEDRLADMLKRPLVISTKAGALRNGNERGHGSVWHLAPLHCDTALCGEFASITMTTWGEPTLTCPRCIKLRDKYQPRVVAEAVAEAEWKAAYSAAAQAEPLPAKAITPIDPNSFIGRIVAACRE